ncbi:MAG: putative capsular polysaccharide synthesis family protein [Opitutaceae bacterium]
MSLGLKLAKELAHFRTHHIAYYTKDPIFLYQMGKVGSTAVEIGLRARGLAVRHIHSLGGDYADQFRFRRARAPLVGRLRKRALGLVHAQLLRWPNRPAKVITLVREPLARNIAAFFQLLRRVLWEEPRFDTRKDIGALELIADTFHRYYRHLTPLTWFETEIHRRLGIDVFAHPFDPARGWSRIRQGNIDLLVLRQENLEACAPVIAEFAGVDRLELSPVNLGERKWYAGLYRDFRAGYVPAPEMIDQLYASRFMQHFYSAAETAEFRRRWLRRELAPPVAA